MILNSAKPDSAEAEALALELERKYSAPVALVNCLELDETDVEGILEMITAEFPAREISVKYPGFIASLDDEHRLKCEIRSAVTEAKTGQMKLSEAAGDFSDRLESILGSNEEMDGVKVSGVAADLGKGSASGRELSEAPTSSATWSR